MAKAARVGGRGYRGMYLVPAAISILVAIGCSSKGSGGLPPAPPIAPGEDGAAQVVDAYIASFAADPVGRPEFSFFAADFGTDGWPPDGYVSAIFGQPTAVALIPGGVRFTWAVGQGGSGNSSQESMDYTRGSEVSKPDSDGIVWVEIVYSYSGTETVGGVAESWAGSGSHHVGLLEEPASGELKIVALGPLRELNEATQPAPSASHFFRAETLSVNSERVYDAGTDTVSRYVLSAAPGDSLAIDAAVASTAFSRKQDDAVVVAVEVSLFDDASPAAELYAAAPALVLFQVVRGATPATEVSLQGTLELPADLAPGYYTLNLSVDTSDVQDVFMAGELLTMPVRVGEAAAP